MAQALWRVEADESRPLKKITTDRVNQEQFNMLLETDFDIKQMNPKLFWTLPMFVKTALWEIDDKTAREDEFKATKEKWETHLKRIEYLKSVLKNKDNWPKLKGYYNTESYLPPFWEMSTS